MNSDCRGQDSHRSGINLPKLNQLGSRKRTKEMVQAFNSAILKLISDITGLASSTVSCRNDAAKLKVRENAEMRRLIPSIESYYHSGE